MLQVEIEPLTTDEEEAGIEAAGLRLAPRAAPFNRDHGQESGR
jgi:hypothetical protein